VKQTAEQPTVDAINKLEHESLSLRDFLSRLQCAQRVTEGEHGRMHCVCAVMDF